MNRAQFDTAVARFRLIPGTSLHIGDNFDVPGRAPYRYAQLTLRRPIGNFTRRLEDLGLLAGETGAYLTMNVYRPDGEVAIRLAASRDLEPDEIPADPPSLRMVE